MKVNIAGAGLIPRIGLLAPVYCKDLNKDTVATILNYSSFKVFVAKNGVEITKKNINEIFDGIKVEVKPVKNEPKPVEPTAIVSTPVEIKQVETPVEFNEEVDAPTIEEPMEPIELNEGDVVDLDDVDESDEVVETSKTFSNDNIIQSKKKKKRH